MTTTPPRRYSWDDYLYPPDPDDLLGQRCLRNLFGVTDIDELRILERQFTTGRAAELAAHPELVPRTFDAEHWRAIHRHLFQDVYEWAGQWRTVNMGKNGSAFLDEAMVGSMAEWTLQQVRTVSFFRGQPRDRVVEGLVDTMDALNTAHPFREGNGRTQRILMEHIAEQADWLLMWDRHRNPFGTDEQAEAMIAIMNGDREPLRELIDRALTPVIRGGADHDADAPSKLSQLQSTAPPVTGNAAQIAQRSTVTRTSTPASTSGSTGTATTPGTPVPPSRSYRQGPDVGGPPTPGRRR